MLKAQTLLMALSLAAGVFISSPSVIPTVEDEVTPPAILTVVNNPDDIARGDFMRTKLMYSQNILEGLTTDDFEQIESAVTELQKITTATKWLSLEDEQYQAHTKDFNRSVEQLQKAVQTKNIDATALRFHQMSIRCIDCHKHVRKAKLIL